LNISSLSVGYRVDDPFQKVGSSLPVVACNTLMPLLEGGMGVEDNEGVRGFPQKKLVGIGVFGAF